MKLKTCIYIVCAIVCGFFIGKFMLKQYDSNFNINSVFKEKTDTYYFLKQGEYPSIEDMEENMMNFTYYIYEEFQGMFITYVGITKDYDNFIKLQGYFNNMGYTTFKTEVNINNDGFSVVVDQYDQLLKSTEDNQAIKEICAQVLARYEELVNNVNND